MMEGAVTRDFDGMPVADRFKAIAERARVTGFSVAGVEKLGVEPDVLRNSGGALEDGSVILTDLASVQGGAAKAFSVRVHGHLFSGSYVGVFALKAADDGRIEKLACGECQSLQRDGREVLRMGKTADLVMLPAAVGYRVLIAGKAGDNTVTVTQ